MTRAKKNLVWLLEWTCRIFRDLLVKLWSWSVLSKHLAVSTKEMLQKLGSKPSSPEGLEEVPLWTEIPKSERHYRSPTSDCRWGFLARETRMLKVV